MGSIPMTPESLGLMGIEPIFGIPQKVQAISCQTKLQSSTTIPSRVANLCGGLFLLEGLAGPDGR
ncbi:hypothetical protein Pyn_39920 [Prunus yedoensis var. nudiflora]|uniref:Uncharacterized protein n=1 Tax=Prunus yedoensis var. nudiflora TaxID=2094558 RepID=A0A314UL05_PRUYE|nr:hypothetical protein Pyn_39920 [Prunus yedoensis var. nudiflora]